MKRIYIHIPFCIAKCAYCDFYSVEGNKWQDSYISALIKEIELRKNEISDKIASLYFGGGTPSFLNEKNLVKIFDTLHKNFTFDPHAEITFEANPENINNEKCLTWKKLRINRLSIGIQSFNEKDLHYLQRIHSAEKALSAIKTARKHFTNLSADLIHGIPDAKDEQIIQNIKTLADMDIPHISMYLLSIEDRTRLNRLISRKERRNVDEDSQAHQFVLAVETAKKYGYQQYEISNFSKPDMEAKHNTAYWKGEFYAGFGSSAHSYNGKTRRWNIANIKKYVEFIEKEEKFYETENIGKKEQYNEFILTRLRLTEGFSNIEFAEKFGEEKLNRLIRKIEKSPYFKISENRLALNSNGLLISDRLMSDLMEV